MLFTGPLARGLSSLALVGSLCMPAVPTRAQSPGPAGSAIEGRAWRGNQSPIPQASLRLRNIVSGTIQATTIADHAGRFVFTNVPPAMYLVELVSEEAKVLAVSATFTAAAGKTVTTFVRLGARVAWFDGLFGNAALVVTAAATMAGVGAISPESVTPVSPNR